MMQIAAGADVFNAREIARAAGVDVRDVRALLESGRVPTLDGEFVAQHEAADLVRSLRTGAALPVMGHALFQGAAGRRREPGVPFAGAALAHAVMLGGFALLLGIGASAPRSLPRIETTHLVFLPLAGEGGGGGGGGLKQPAPAPKALLAGASKMRSPVPTRKVEKGPETKPEPAPEPDPEPTPKPADPPPP